MTIGTKHRVLARVSGFAAICVICVFVGAEPPQYGGHLRVGYGIEPTSLDAVLGRSGGDAYYWRQIYDQLVDADVDLQPRLSSSLATSWEISTDPDAITFHLREGVTFHDGTPFDAQAVKFNIERVLDPRTKATPRASMTVIESVDVVAEHIVRFNLKRPWGAGLGMLADRGGVMNSPTGVAALGRDYGWNPSGTGPFRIDKVVTGTYVHLVRNERYWATDEHGNSLPYLDEVTIRVIRDQTVLSAALRTGEIDVAYLPYKDVSAFLRDDRFQIETMEGGGIALLLAFDVAKPPLDNVNLRLAIAHAVNPEVINRAIFFNRVMIADSGMWPVGSWVHDPDVPRPYYDPEKAKQYMREGGKPDGFEFTTVTNNSPINVPAAEIVRAMLKKIGITMNIEVLSTGPATERFFHGRVYPMYLTGWSRYPEPDWIASLAFKSDGYYNAGNLPRPDIDRLVETGASLYDLDARKRIYRQINQTVLGEAWFVPLLYGINYAAAPKKIRNLDQLMGWDGKMSLRKIWIKQ
ncbi:MAG: ABC transporter substrate-binding protein [Gammaproteobacteria bacterium]|nr:ABC transporter substrate-binding protein [Gammaproteobacteria bacterium]